MNIFRLVLCLIIFNQMLRETEHISPAIMLAALEIVVQVFDLWK